MNDYRIKSDSRDWVWGDGHVKLRANGNPDWTGNYHFRELQMIGGFETDDCVIFSFQESFDAQMDRMIQAGEVAQSIVDWFTLNGYMDSVNSDDGKPHFHSSERFIGYCTGNGFNGNASQDPVKAAQTFGIVPWTQWPFDATITPQTYFDKPPQALYDLGSLFLAQIGGSKSIPYHWVYQGTDCPRSLMDAARQTAPLMLGVATNDGWNQVQPTPPPIGTPPNHCVDNYNANTIGELFEDHYVPYEKIFVPSYPIPQVFQFVLSVSPPPAPPTLPTNPTTVQTVSWLQSVVSWLQNLVESITPQGRAKLGGASRSDKWPAFRAEYAKTHLPVCAICGGTAKLNLHHLRPFHVFPELELDPTNVVWLCNKNLCHIRVGHLSNFQSINPNGAADIVIWRDKIRNRPNTPDEIKADFNQQ